MYRNELSKNYEDNDPLKQLHLYGIPLSYEEPALVYGAQLRDQGVYLMIWDGDSAYYPIASDFKTFFTHWLASGCFRNGEFEQYWKIVKEHVPINIPPSENKWLNYYKHVYG